MLRVQEILPKAQAEVGRYCVVFSRFGCLPAAGILMHGGLEQSHNIHSKQTGCLAVWLPAWLPGCLAACAWLPGCLASRLLGYLATWLAGWLAGWLADWLAGWLAGWLLAA
jgi:hypothetical protein